MQIINYASVKYTVFYYSGPGSPCSDAW